MDLVDCLGCGNKFDIDEVLDASNLSEYQVFWISMDHRCPDCSATMNKYEDIWAFLETRHHYERRQLLKENFHLTGKQAQLLLDLSQVESLEVVHFIQSLIPEESIKVRDWRKENEALK